MNKFLEFDKLKAELTVQLKRLNESDLDNLVAAHKTAIEIHAKCEKILEEAREYLGKLPESQETSPICWIDFKDAKQKIEELSADLGSDSLNTLIGSYTKLFFLVREYQRRLEETKNTIRVLEKQV